MKASNLFNKHLLSWKGVLILYILLSSAAAFQSISLGNKVYEGQITQYTHYNNYLIFKNSHHHLMEGSNLYQSWPEETWDLFKYSPTFAYFFGPLAALPDWAGLGFWNLINALSLFLAIYFMPVSNKKKQLFILLALGIEALTSFQSQQSNALMAGLMIGAFVLMEREKLFWAAGLLMFSVYIKLFGLVGFALFLFYPDKLKAAYSTLIWGVVFFAAPLISIEYTSLIEQYKNWGVMLANDHSTSLGFSVMGWLHSWFHLNINKNIMLLFGVMIYLIPVFMWKKWKYKKFRLLMLASTLIWVVIFNHKAESPTFVIAMAGATIWFFYSAKTKFDVTLFVLAFVFTSLSPTDIFPSYVRTQIFVPYVVKSVPMIIIWGKIIYELTLGLDKNSVMEDEEEGRGKGGRTRKRRKDEEGGRGVRTRRKIFILF